jgi:hypothetical protein
MKKKFIGIWMDHASANLIEIKNGIMETKTIVSKFTHEEKKETLHKGEKAMHHKEQHEESNYYMEIAAIILNFEDVLLFGATEAKDELLNILKADHRFDKINIETRTFDKMTENKQHGFVKEYFSKHLSDIV